MYDFAFDLRTLSREFTKSDFASDPNLLDEAYRASIVADARDKAASGLSNFSLRANHLRGKPIYQIGNLADALIMRKFARNIRRLSRVRQSDRNTIIKSLKQILSEGHTFRVYKLDLKSFYESIDRSWIEDQLRRDGGLSPPTLHVFQFISTALNGQGVNGLPRGLSISAVLSEYAMRIFDQTVKSQQDVYYYARYVDDIVILTTGDENKKSFLKRVRRCLPRGVSLNHAKTKVIDFSLPKVNNEADQTVEAVVDFLGYRFSVYRILNKHRRLSRRVYADISPNKVARFKTRITLSAIQFNKDKNYDDLIDRVTVLSGNYNMYDFNRKIRRNVGIYYNYRFIDFNQSAALKELDSFLKSLFLAQTGKVAGALNQNLSAAQRRNVLKLSFARSFATRSFSHFKIDRLTHLVGCWAYE